MKQTNKIGHVCCSLLSAACVVTSLVTSLSSCGGGTAGTGAAPIPTVTRYFFVAPKVGTQLTYSEQIVDNSSNQINLTYTETVVPTSQSGNYAVTENDPSNNSVTVNGTSYAVTPLTVTLNNSGQVLTTLNNNNQVTCTYAPFGLGPTYPLTVGANWTNNYTETCGTNAAVSFAETGTVLDLESITVPAGTFSALKLQNTLVYTDANGTVHNKFFNSWRDAATGIMVKREVSDLISGTPITNGYPLLITYQLQTGTP